MASSGVLQGKCTEDAGPDGSGRRRGLAGRGDAARRDRWKRAIRGIVRTKSRPIAAHDDERDERQEDRDEALEERDDVLREGEARRSRCPR